MKIKRMAIAVGAVPLAGSVVIWCGARGDNADSESVTMTLDVAGMTCER